MKYRIAIIPSEQEEDHYENVTTIRHAKARSRKYERDTGDATSLEVFEYSTSLERDAFIDGYNAMCGWMGEGRFITEDKK